MPLLTIATEPFDCVKSLEHDPPHGVDVQVGQLMTLDVGESLFEGTIQFAMGVGSSLLAAFIYERLKKENAKQAYVNRETIPLEYSALQAAIEKTIPKGVEPKTETDCKATDDSKKPGDVDRSATDAKPAQPSGPS
jgi:hypothetical protein